MKVELGWSLHFQKPALDIVPETQFEAEYLKKFKGESDGLLAELGNHPSYKHGFKVEITPTDKN